MKPTDSSIVSFFACPDGGMENLNPEVSCMTVVKWNPFHEVQSFQQDVNRLFSRFDGGEVNGRQNWLLPVDVIESPELLTLRAAIAGVDPNDIKVEVENDVLTISAERRLERRSEEKNRYWIEQHYGTFRRSISLPQTVDSAKIEASYQNGMLELTLPRREETKPRRIELTVNAPALEESPAEEAVVAEPVTV